MKTRNATVVLTLALSLFPCGNSPAFTAVKDNFNEPELNAKRWKLVESGNARLRYADGSLHLTVGTKANKQPDHAYVELRHNQPGYNESWMVRLNAYNISGNGNKTGVGFWIFNADDPKDAMLFELNSSRESPENRMSARASFLLNDTKIETELERVVRNKEDVDLIVTFNHRTKLFTLYWGFFESTILDDLWKWREVGTFSPTGDGGDANADWQMNAGSGRFGIRLAGFGGNEAVKSGDARIAYFALKPTTKLPE